MMKKHCFNFDENEQQKGEMWLVYINSSSAGIFIRLHMYGTASGEQLRICFVLLLEPSTVGSKVNWRESEREREL